MRNVSPRATRPDQDRPGGTTRRYRTAGGSDASFIATSRALGEIGARPREGPTRLARRVAAEARDVGSLRTPEANADVLGHGPRRGQRMGHIGDGGQQIHLGMKIEIGFREGGAARPGKALVGAAPDRGE